MELSPLFGVPVGPELLIIVLLVILLFGANRIPKLARSSGEAIGEFRKGREKAEDELNEIREEALEETADSRDESGTNAELKNN